MSRKKSKAASAVDCCPQCGGRQRRSHENFYLPLVGGAWGVTVENAEIIHCSSCGQRGISLHRPGPLMRGIAGALARKKARLAPAEITFLRQHIGFTGARLGKTLGVTGSSVSRWEKGREPIGPQADRLLRTIVMLLDHGEDTFDPADLEAIEDGAAPMRITLRQDPKGNWRAAAA